MAVFEEVVIVLIAVLIEVIIAAIPIVQGVQVAVFVSIEIINNIVGNNSMIRSHSSGCIIRGNIFISSYKRVKFVSIIEEVGIVQMVLMLLTAVVVADNRRSVR